MSNNTTPAAMTSWHELARALRIDGRAVIDGQRRDAASGATFECRSPIDGRLLCAVARGAQADIDTAVASARTAFDDPVNGIGRGVLADGSFAKGEAVGTNRYALSAGLNYLFDENTVFKLELRRDGADQPVFEVVKKASFSKSNNLFGAAVVVSF